MQEKFQLQEMAWAYVEKVVPAVNGVGICRKSCACKKWSGLMANYLITTPKSKQKKLKNKLFFGIRRNKLALPMKSMKLKVGQVCFFLYVQSDQNEEDIGSILGRIKQVIFLSPRCRRGWARFHSYFPIAQAKASKQREYPGEEIQAKKISR